MRAYRTHKSGMTFMDVLVGIGILLIVFVGVYGALRASLLMVALSKSSSGALALANQQLEMLRSLPYSDVGTLAGIPAGTIAQNATTTLNGVEYNVRTFIQYVDDDADGLGGADANSIPADYKVVKVEVTWDVRGSTKSYSLVSNIVPVGIETLDSGGTLTINTFDALGAPVINAEVRIVNNTTTPVIDVTSFSNTSGIVSFPGAPESSEYEVTVSKAGYNKAKTYDATPSLPNPNPAHLSVIDGDTTTISFSIDQLSTKTVETYEPIATTTFVDIFSTGVYVASSTVNIVVSGGEMRLVDPGSGYSLATGTAQMTEVSSLYLESWVEMRFNNTVPASTDSRFRFYHDDGGVDPTIIPDIDLPGNAAGFVSSPIDLSGLSTTTYDELVVEMELKTDDASSTPSIQDWTIEYAEGPIPLPNIPFNLRGSKTIGTDASSDPVYKVNENNTTDANGTYSTTTLEWDIYNVTVDDGATGYDISEACEPQPLSILPNADITTKLILVPDTAHTLLVSVRDDTGALLPGADVRLYRTAGIDITETTGGCGQVFFENVPEGTISGADAYIVEVTHGSFLPDSQTDVEVTGVSTHNVTLFP